MWFYGLHANNCGTYVKKPMTQCSGEEIMREFLYYCGLEDKIDEIMPHITAIPVVMPYITSQFMPRKLKDRPEVIPAGNRNLAFIGQFVELEGDVVFTVETSVRTAIIAVYRMLHLDRPITPLFQGQYDIRMVNVALKTLLGKDNQRSAEGQSPEAPADHARDRECHESDPARAGVLFRAEGKSISVAMGRRCQSVANLYPKK